MGQSNGIIADPNAQKLRRLWFVKATFVSPAFVPSFTVGMGDLYGTGRGAWAHGVHKDWNIYRFDSGEIASMPTMAV